MKRAQIIKGAYAEAMIFASDLEPEARYQIDRFLNHKAFANAKIRIMPDVHAGIGAVIGFTSTLGDKVIPNVIGVDIGCGVACWKLGQSSDISLKFESLDRCIRKNIPAGFAVHKDISPYLAECWETCGFAKDQSLESFLDSVKYTAKDTKQNPDRVLRSLGTLGGGNHFIEIDKGHDGNLWLVFHSGSRNFGLSVARYHQNQALLRCGKQGGLEYLEGDEAQLYLQHLKVAALYAQFNRTLMAYILVKKFWGISLASLEKVESVHNTIDFRDNIIRKGAISAKKDEHVVIPWNMRDGLILAKGKGNPEWNESAPHGSGRKLGRRAAKQSLSLEAFKASMKGIWTSCVSYDTLDESPMAYKDTADILAWLDDTVEVLDWLKPLYNFKAADD